MNKNAARPQGMTKRMKRTVLSAVCIVSAHSVHAELWVPSIFQKGMVLQCQKPVPVWGEAAPGSEVTLSFAGQTKMSIADVSGRWKVVLDPLDVSITPRELTISSSNGDSALRLADVLVGEVWVLAGQSNMGWPLGKCEGGPEAAAQAEYPWLRMFKQRPFEGASDAPARDVTGGQWIACDPQEAAKSPGVGFFFARKLYESLPADTPIALINTQMGGTYAECWIDRQTLESIPEARGFLDKAAREIVSGSEAVKGFWGENNFRRPSALFYGKVAPIQPFAVRGIIWYQGEGNASRNRAPKYAGLLKALIASWRDGWQSTDLPFLVVQLPRYDAGPDSDWPGLRAAQEKAAREVANVHLVVTIDRGQKEVLHPSDKEPVGERLALMARAKVYGDDVACDGPFFQTLEISGGAAYLTFSNSEGLHLKGSEGFEIRGANGMFAAAEAEVLQDGRVRVVSPEVAEPTAVRYAWFNWGAVCLFNGAGLPAAPFSTE